MAILSFWTAILLALLIFMVVQIITFISTKIVGPGNEKQRLPPGPFRWPLIGNIGIFLTREPRKKFLQLRQKYGPVFTIAAGTQNIICLAEHEVIKEALVKQGDNFAGRPKLFLIGVSQRGHNGLAMTDDNIWREHRRFALRTLKNFGVGRSAVIEKKIYVEITKLTYWLDEFADDISDKPHDLSHPLEFCVTNILANMIFGCTFERDDKEFLHFKRLVDDSFKSMVSFGAVLCEVCPVLTEIPILSTIFGYEKMRRQDDEISAFLRKHMRKCEERLDDDMKNNCTAKIDDFATAFLVEMRAQKSNHDKMAVSFNERQWLAVINDLILAGIETTAVALKWIFLMLSTHPDVQENIHKEIDQIIGPDRSPTVQDRYSMPYTRAALCECLRLANIIPYNLPHRTHEPTTLAGFHIPANSWILPQISAVHWDDNVFTDPQTFDPCRFLDYSESENMWRFKKMEQCVPFSLGKRACLGENLAQMEIFLIVTSVFQRYILRKEAERDKFDITGIVGLTMSPLPYKCLLTRRKSD